MISEEFEALTHKSRKEDKYILTKAQADNLMLSARKMMAPGYPDPSTIFTLVRSQYFDSPNGEFFCNHVNRVKNREKIRVRMYGPNGNWDPNSEYVERKFRLNEVDGTKTRARLRGVQQTDLEAKFFQSINQLSKSLRLSAVLEVRYLRYAFADTPADFRLTFDHDVQFFHLGHIAITRQIDWDRAKSLASKVNSNREVIMEVKHNGKMPAWFLHELESYDLKPTQFSKYVKGVFQFL